MLLTASVALVPNLADAPELLALASHAPCPLILFSAVGETEQMARHRASGGEVLFASDNQAILARGAALVATAPLPPGAEIAASLAALGLRWALGLYP